jgi:TM2 domain-containing membrane protein YozV
MAEGQSEEKKGPDRTMCGILAIILGWVGVHKFMMGQTTGGVILLCVSLLSCFLLQPVSAIIGLIEGIIYLTKTDEQFYQTYVVEKKAWF